MTLLRQYRIASFLLVLLAIVSFAIAELDFTMLFIGVVLATSSWYVTEGPRGRALPEWVANLLVVSLLAWTAYDFMMFRDLVEAMAVLGEFLLWLLVIKLFAHRTNSEDRQRLTLATLLVVAGCLESVQLVFGVLVLVYAALAVWTTMLWRLTLSAESARASRAANAGFALPLEIAIGRRAAPQFRGLVIIATATIFALSAGVFVLFPRFSGRTGGPRHGHSVSGFNDEIQLGNRDRVNDSRRELFTVRWKDSSGALHRAVRPLLLRGAVLDHYDPNQQRWSSDRRSTSIQTFRTSVGDHLSKIGRGDVEASLNDSIAEIEMRSLATDVVFSLYAPVAMATPETRLIAFDPTTMLLRDVSTDRVGRYWSYRLQVDQQPSTALLESLATSESSTERAVSFPVPKMRAIAQSMLNSAKAGSNLPSEPQADSDAAIRWTYNREIARALASWMKANFTYSTDLSSNARVENEDPIVTFLQSSRNGHCEYFASGLCAALRALGVDSRVVTGFIAIEFDDDAMHYVVRESNAHAWVEVRTGEFAWTAVDATPEDTLLRIAGENRSFIDRFRWIYGRVEFLWNSRVVAYDAAAQTTIAQGMQSQWRAALGERMTSASNALRTLAARFNLGAGASAFWFAIIALGATTATLAMLIVRVHRNRVRKLLHIEGLTAAQQRILLRDAAFYAQALRELDSVGVSKPRHLTPRAFALELGTRDHAVGLAFAEIAEQFYRVRYGGHTPSASEASSHQSLVLAFRALLWQNLAAIRAD